MRALFKTIAAAILAVPLAGLYAGSGWAKASGHAPLTNGSTPRGCVDTGQFIIDGAGVNELSNMDYNVSMAQTDAKGTLSWSGEYLTIKNRREGAITWSATDDSGGATVSPGAEGLFGIGPHPLGVTVNLGLCAAAGAGRVKGG